MTQTPGMWYVRFRGQVQGPYSVAQLRQQLERGRFSRQHEVSDDGATWRRATDIPELFASRVRKKQRSDLMQLDEPELVAAPLPTGARPTWYYSIGDERHGPSTLLELRRLVTDGQLVANDLVWNNGFDDWVPLIDVPDLAGSLPTLTAKVEPVSAPATPSGSFCFACGSPTDPRAEICPKCGVRQKHSASSGKDRVTAALLALFLGGLGAHHFYLGNTFVGVIYVLFFWTFIPAIVAFVEGIVFLCMSDSNFQKRYCQT